MDSEQEIYKWLQKQMITDHDKDVLLHILGFHEKQRWKESIKEILDERGVRSIRKGRDGEDGCI